MVDLSPVIDPLFGLPGVALFALTVYLLIRAVKIVEPYERYVVSDGETVEAVLDPGLHVVSPADWGDSRVDMRTMDYEGTVDHCSTADGVPVAFEVVYEFAVTDPGKAAVETDDYIPPEGTDWYDHQTAGAERLGEAVVEAVEDRTWEDLAGAEEALAAAARAAAEPDLEAWGMELATIEVRDPRRREADDGAGDDEASEDEGEQADGVQVPDEDE